MIDVHVLTHSGTKDVWLAQCLASLAPENCTVHVVEGFEGHIGKGRARGYQLGAHEFVACVDSDDFVLPGVMDECLNALTTHRAVMTMQWILTEQGARANPAHAMAVYRRRDVGPFLGAFAQAQYRGDRALMYAMEPKQLAFFGHVWRLHAGGAHHNKYPVPNWSNIRAAHDGLPPR